MIYYKVLVISPGHFIKLNIRKYRLQWQRYSKKKKKAYEMFVSLAATDCHYIFFFSNTTAKAFTKKKKCLSSAYGHFNFSSDERE